MISDAGSPRRILHVGCGTEPLPAWLGGEEVRLDLDPASNPDIIASMTDLGDIGTFDMVYCSHALEHVYPHEAPVALSEFFRVLTPGGSAIVMVPDVEDVRPTEEVLYTAPAGPVTGLDILYGMRRFLAQSPAMAHHNGFTADTLRAAFEKAGFAPVETKRLACFNLFGVGLRP